MLHFQRVLETAKGGGRMFRLALAVVLAGLVVLQFTGGLRGLQREWPSAVCWDLTPSFSGHAQGTCSHHAGVLMWLANMTSSAGTTGTESGSDLTDEEMQSLSWIGTYSCLVDDTSEISDGERGRGHAYFDLDGDSSDPITQIEMRIEKGIVRVQSVFANQATKGMKEFKIVAATSDDRRPSIVGFAQEPLTGRAELLVVMHDRISAKYGFSMSTSSYSTPLLQDGESIAMVDLKLAHCVRR